LRPEQQHLLAGIGLTEPVARTAVPDPATRHPAMETGLYYARAFASEHGHLDAPPTARQDGFPLGRWLVRQRHQASLHRDRFETPWPHEEHLSRIDPYWHPPWGMAWQRRYQAARAQLTPGHNLAPEQGFPGTPDWTGQWLYEQSTHYNELHPRQQLLLTGLGLPPEGARAARPRRTTQTAAFTTGLRHARTWADQHGHLTVPADTRHDGYPLGIWLTTQRKRATGGKLPDERAQALAALDPWWNPPWPIRWQHALHNARTHTTGRTPTSTADLDALPVATAKWLFTQAAAYDSLHPGQHQLLADIGITAESAHALAPQPNPTRQGGPARPRLKNPPSSLDAGLPYARTYAAHNGNLTSAGYLTEHDGFPLGWWLHEQRKRANAHLRRTGQPWPHDAQLTALDPWWNPPWRASWNHSYHQAHTHHTAGRPYPDTITKWIRTQQRAWDQLHPHQQHLLATLGIHGPTPLYRHNSRPADPPGRPAGQ
jgi:hypothetical protein